VFTGDTLTFVSGFYLLLRAKKLYNVLESCTMKKKTYWIKNNRKYRDKRRN